MWLCAWGMWIGPGPVAPDYVPIGDMQWGLVCSPALDLDPTQKPIKVNGLHHSGEQTQLASWAALAGVEMEETTSRQLPQLAVITEAVANAMGVALMEKRLIAEELDDGRLIAPFGFLRCKDALGAYVRSDNLDRPDVKTLLDWLKAEAASGV